jgi:hypothetical protein
MKNNYILYFLICNLNLLREWMEKKPSYFVMTSEVNMQKKDLGYIILIFQAVSG